MSKLFFRSRKSTLGCLKVYQYNITSFKILQESKTAMSIKVTFGLQIMQMYFLQNLDLNFDVLGYSIILRL